MIKKINIVRYRKITNLEINFSSQINVISGTNGTCKTSLLHIVSNSFQAVTKTCDWLQDTKCLDIINKVNSITNPKIEKLTKGDKKYNDPAYGQKGTILKVEYINHAPLPFRKHNSPKSNRYAVKPYYGSGAGDSLPYCPIIYLGLSRLFPFGEFQNEEAVNNIKIGLPMEYQKEIAAIYHNFTQVNIVVSAPQQMGDIKVRSDFTSDIVGVDSNTISAGEDNLFMLLTALVSLKYYFESIISKNDVESILLIDELDATLHPSYQLKIIDLFRKYAKDYKIQIIFTTHSLTLLEYALEKKDNVIYLIDNITSVKQMSMPDIYKIKMFLYNLTANNIYSGKKIPIFTEDAEARTFLLILLEYIAKNKKGFHEIKDFVYLVDTKIGASNLKSIFKDEYLLKSTLQSICILDGDQTKDLNHNIILLPGEASPETLIMNYSIELCDNDDPFWVNKTILDLNYGKSYYMSTIRPDIENIPLELQRLRQEGETTHGKERELRKETFNKHEDFFRYLFRWWVHDLNHKIQIDNFCKDLHIVFYKVADFHGINPKLWGFD